MSAVGLWSIKNILVYCNCQKWAMSCRCKAASWFSAVEIDRWQRWQDLGRRSSHPPTLAEMQPACMLPGVPCRLFSYLPLNHLCSPHAVHIQPWMGSIWISDFKYPKMFYELDAPRQSLDDCGTETTTYQFVLPNLKQVKLKSTKKWTQFENQRVKPAAENASRPLSGSKTP